MKVIQNISGEDAVHITRKNRVALSRRLKARVVFAGNAPPHLSEKTGALKRRLVFIPFFSSGRAHEHLENA